MAHLSYPIKNSSPSSQDSERKSTNILFYQFGEMIWNWNWIFTEGRLQVFDQKVRSFRTFSKLLEPLQYKTTLSIMLHTHHIGTVNISKLWSKFWILIWAFGRLHSMVMILKPMTFYKNTKKYVLPFFWEITTETNFDLILSSPDDEWFQIIILFLVSAHCISKFTQKTELQIIILTRK